MLYVDGWIGLGWMVFIGHRSSKSIFGGGVKKNGNLDGIKHLKNSRLLGLSRLLEHMRC